MASRTINITEDAYDLLASHKRPGESFTDVIERLAGRPRLSELAGILSPDEGEALAQAIAGGRARSRERRERQHRDLSGGGDA